jgi:hypothetical protein
MKMQKLLYTFADGEQMTMGTYYKVHKNFSIRPYYKRKNSKSYSWDMRNDITGEIKNSIVCGDEGALMMGLYTKVAPIGFIEFYF